jgi:glycosyltransferase involved in cell wall biosynthesis
MKIVLTANTSWYLYNFRLQLIKDLLELNHDIYVLAPNDSFTIKLKELNIKHIPLRISSHGTSIYKDFFLIVQYIYYFLKIRPSIIHNFTIKPVIFGGLASKFFKALVINSVPGLGLMFNTVYRNPTWLKKFIILLYKLSFSKKNKIIFQNPDDLNFFVSNKISDFNQSYLIKGSGINCKYFNNSRNISNGTVRFGIMSRMIWSKGIKEFVDASKKIHEQNNNTSFHILGSPPNGNPDKISIKWLEDLNEKYKFVHWMPHSDEVYKFLNEIDVFVLPTYYPEGVPKSLLEAASMGLPIIASNTSGCKEIVKNNINGFLVDIKDEVDLFNKMLLLSKKENLRKDMGYNSRKIAEREFDVSLINEQTLRIYFD